MLRLVVSEEGQGELPAIDLDDAVIVIGSSVTARVRLPASVAQPEHVRIEGGRWRALANVTVDGEARDGGEIGDGVALQIGAYRVQVAPAPAGVAASPPQRTESLARELMRNLMGTAAAPTFEVERGPVVGARRMLPAPESVTIIGRGDEASWIVLDEDLSRAHAEVRRGWDGTRIVDLGSKNGTRVDGVSVGRDGALLRDGVLVELGKVAMRYRDPAEQQLGVPLAASASVVPGARSAAAPAPSSATPAATVVASPAAARAATREPAVSPQKDAGTAARPSTAPFYVAVAIMIAALAGLVWILSV